MSHIEKLYRCSKLMTEEQEKELAEKYSREKLVAKLIELREAIDGHIEDKVDALDLIKKFNEVYAFMCEIASLPFTIAAKKVTEKNISTEMFV